MFSFCMYCFSQRCAAITISFFSALLILASGATVYLMVRMKEDSGVWDLQSDPETGKEMQAMKLGVFWGIISLCGVSILTGTLGFLTARFKSCCTISFFSFFTLILTFLFLVAGGVLLTVTIAARMQID